MSELDRLIRFVAVAEELSFSQAAKRLNVDQPWLSRQIQQLESHLGFPLFVRSTRKVTLTAEGLRLFDTARGLALAANESRQCIRDMTRSHNSSLAIGVNPFSYWVPERHSIMETFQQRHERVSMDVVSNYTSRLLSKLRKRLIDLAIVQQPFDADGLETMIIHTSTISLLVPPEDALARHKAVPLSALAGRRMPMTNPQLNSAFSEMLYGPLIEAGMIPTIVPEGEPAVPHFAAIARSPVVNIGWPHNIPGPLIDFVHVEFEGPVPEVTYLLVRRLEAHRGLVDHFWNNAARIVAGQVKPTPTSLDAQRPVRRGAALADTPLKLVAAR